MGIPSKTLSTPADFFAECFSMRWTPSTFFLPNFTSFVLPPRAVLRFYVDVKIADSQNVDKIIKMSTKSLKCRQNHQNVGKITKMSTQSSKCRKNH
jgi:hypothetical protein